MTPLGFESHMAKTSEGGGGYGGTLLCTPPHWLLSLWGALPVSPRGPH